MRPLRWLALLACCMVAFAQEIENEESRKVLGSSVVTSVSVIMDHGNGTKTYITDAAGQPLDQTEGAVGSPVDLLNPDRYEFYTFDETGDLVKRLMTLDQIKGLLAGGDGETLDSQSNSPTFYHDSLSSSHLDESDLEPNVAQGVHNVVASVQNVLRSELEASKIKKTTSKPPLSIPDSISSWSMLFPAIIGDSSEALDDDTGNGVNEPIDIDRIPASSNNEKTEIKISPDDATTEGTTKPTAVPPIIHFLEIQSVPAKSPTKTPTNFTSTTPVMSTTESPTTEKATSPVNPILEMSASISSLLSQVTDNQTSVDIENKTSITSEPSTTVKTTNEALEKSPTVKPELKPESSNLKTVTKRPEKIETRTASPVSSSNLDSKPSDVVESTALPSKTSKPDLTTSTEGSVKQTTVKDVTESSNTSKKTTDTVVSFITTAKPVLKTNGVVDDKTKPSSTTTVKQKIQVTTPVSTKKNGVKNQTLTTTTKSPITVNKTNKVNETLETLGSEEVVKIVPNKQAQAANKVKDSNQTKSSPSNATNPKPHKKVPNNKPHSPDCEHSKKTPPAEVKNKEKLDTAASTHLSESLKPSQLKTPVLQEVKIVPKPTSSQSNKPLVHNKINPSDDIKITTYKPSTSQPFTTKPSLNKISTTTERLQSENKITSESKIHEVNSSLFDIKNHVLDIHDNTTEVEATTILTITNSTEATSNISNHESAASKTEEIKLPSSTQTNATNPLESNTKSNETDGIDHSAEITCTHNKKPVHTSIQDKINDAHNDFAASNAEEVKLTTGPFVPTTEPELTTEISNSKDLTTESITEITSTVLAEDLTTTLKSEVIATDLPETTTLNMPEMDFVKEGISAVTNILLDSKPALEPQLPLPTIPLSESASNIVLSPPVKGELKHASSFDDSEMTTNDPIEESTTVVLSSTTEKEKIIYFTTTDPPTTETEIPTTENIVGADSNIQTTNIEDGIEVTTESETTTVLDETTTATYEEIEHKEPSESKIVSTINSQTLPTKESKLSPENINETAETVILCNHTLSKINETKGVPSNDVNNTEVQDHLEPAQSIVSEVNKISSDKVASASQSVSVETTPKNSIKDDNLSFKTALKPDPSKYTQVKYPGLQSAYRPVPETPISPPTAVELHPAPHESMGLEATTAFLADDVRRFADLCNELAFRMWTSITGKGSISSRSLVLSPFATTSLLAMVFLGARGPTSGQMNDVLRLDDMVTFNPHQVLQNVTESVLNSRNYGVTTAAFVRELYSDKLKGKILDFYKERAQQYYDGHVEEIAFNVVGDILRRRTNLLVKRQTLGKVPEYLRGSTLSLRPPLAAFSANIFQTDCDLASTEGRDGEMYFVVRPSTRQRRLVPVPAAVWRTGFLAGYEPGLDATAVALGTDSVVSTVLVLPGQQGQVAPGDGLARLEQRLIETSYRRGGWTRLLRSLLPRPGLELQVPRFSHRSVLNVTSTLQRMGLKDLFIENRADLRGLNGLSNDLHLSDMVQVNTFSTCGDDTIGARHHIETYPVSPQRMGRDDPELYPRPEDFEDSDILKVPLNLRPRQARLPDNPRLRFDRPFLYMVRHNPTGMILHMGRFNPRLLP
ncbi:LOW QUALITY PROTEIN: mucin-5AC-like [Homalodisca vitripennis]|uniref:LOW QUALITY PROTEIN: mucin-5AC-like n=1 Tax=Homalodisca vitripennis TaxID=197043 RepID=UPI001EECA9E9|nr:LOW QUALITY PROTEIN: mucin-5AC-like [Homalodisca vitripennis]